jgi:hypothetical protein
MNTTSRLQRNEIQSHTLRAGDQLRAIHGTIWLTQGGKDVILHVGQAYRSTTQGTAVIEAVAPAYYEIVPSQAVTMPAVIANWIRQWLALGTGGKA